MVPVFRLHPRLSVSECDLHWCDAGFAAEVGAAALLREKKLKRWRRAWKDERIEAVNPNWADLADQIPL